MKTTILTFLFILTGIRCEGALTQEIEYADPGDETSWIKKSAFRNGELILKIVRLETNGDGEREFAIEQFYAGGELILTLAHTDNSQSLVVERNSEAEISFIYHPSTWEPTGITFDFPDETFESFNLETSGYFWPISDREMDRRNDVQQAHIRLMEAYVDGDEESLIDAAKKLLEAPNQKPNK